MAPQPPLYVSPDGRDTNDGASPATPLATIQAAPGEGDARARRSTSRPASTARSRPPCATAPRARRSRSRGRRPGRTGRAATRPCCTAPARIFNIDHSWITLDGFTIDGQEQLGDVPFPTDLRTIDAWKASVQDRVEDGRLVYIGSAEESRDLTGITISNMFLNGAGGECVRLRNNAHGNTIIDSVIQYCGMYGKGDGGGPGRVPQRRGRLHRHQPQVGRPADVRQRHQLAATSSRATSSARSGRSASTSRRTRTTTCSRTTSAAATPSRESSRAATSSCAATRTSCATTRSRTAPATPSRSRPTARSTTGAATSSRTTSSPAPRPRPSRSSRTRAGPVLRQQRRRLRSAVQRRQRRHDAVGDHHPLLTRSRAAPARVVVDSGNGGCDTA